MPKEDFELQVLTLLTEFKKELTGFKEELTGIKKDVAELTDKVSLLMMNDERHREDLDEIKLNLYKTKHEPNEISQLLKVHGNILQRNTYDIEVLKTKESEKIPV